MQNTFSLTATDKSNMAKAGTLMVLRGVPGTGEISRYNRLGFDGYAVTDEPHA